MPAKKRVALSVPSEAELAATLINYLRDTEGWTIYQEVQVRSYGSVADIIAVKNGKEVMVVETKNSFGLAVLSQASHWRDQATYVAVGVPRPKRRKKSKSSAFGEEVAWKFGIGVYLIDVADSHVVNRIKGKKNPEAKTEVILDVLTEAHKTYAKAGNAKGKRLSRFRMTVQQLIAYVEAHPRCGLKKAVKEIKHHYKNNYNASSSLGKQIVRYGTVEEIVGEWDPKIKDLRLSLRDNSTPSQGVFCPIRRLPLDSTTSRKKRP